MIRSCFRTWRFIKSHPLAARHPSGALGRWLRWQIGSRVISCPRGALPEIVRDGVDGFLVNGVEAACAAVSKLPVIKRADCRQRAEKEFSSEVVASLHERLYQGF